MAAIVIESNNGLNGGRCHASAFRSRARAPAGGEAVAYSLMTGPVPISPPASLMCLGLRCTISTVTFMNLVWLNGLTTFLRTFGGAVLPKALVSRRDAEVEEAMEVGSRDTRPTRLEAARVPTSG